jgi:coproporphyrinogen III oxidase-like Fe-S oxidoreductase
VDKCLYCNFYSVPRRSVGADVPEAVVRQTIEQMRFIMDALGCKLPPPTVFMGGGTPSTLPRPVLRKLLRSSGQPHCEEWTVEANPESIDEGLLEICEEAGVTRISAGVQSTNDRLLRALRRTGSRGDIMRAVALLRRRWAGDLNLDFIAGIPGQTRAEVAEDLSLLDEIPTSHVSLYSLTYEPETALARMVDRGEVHPNSPGEDEELWFCGVEELLRRGYLHYEVSNFCRPAKECRHNLRYWRLEPYLGVGPGAVSTLPAEPIAAALHRPELREQGMVLRISNPRDIRSFLAGREDLWGAQLEPVKPKDFLLETLMMGLRLQTGILTRAFEARFGSSFDEIFPGLWQRWVERGAALPPGERLALSDFGRMVLDGLLSEIRVDPDERRLQVCWP